MTAVLAFARAPGPGTVKSRLAATVGAPRALALYRELGRRVVMGVARRFDVTVWYDPPDAVGEMRAWLGAHRLRPQVAGDLGTRLAAAVAAHAAEGAQPIILIGVDAPSVDAGTVAMARAELRHVDVVLQPALDGGYCLIGLRQPAPALFRDVPWGGPDVLRHTIARCRALGRSWETLAPGRDLDTAADLYALGLSVS